VRGLLSEHGDGIVPRAVVAMVGFLADVKALQFMLAEDVIAHIVECNRVAVICREPAYRANEGSICA
jgi:hypothetical protein